MSTSRSTVSPLDTSASGAERGNDDSRVTVYRAQAQLLARGFVGDGVDDAHRLGIYSQVDEQFGTELLDEGDRALQRCAEQRGAE
jgi:hypothetical protein